jgi:hypothetical protein
MKVRFKSGIQEALKKLDTIPDVAVYINNPPKQRSRNSDYDVSYWTRSKAGSIDRNIGDRKRFKI